MICCNVEKTVEAKEEMEAIVGLEVVLILMSMYNYINVICCNVEEETVEGEEGVEPTSAATGTYI